MKRISLTQGKYALVDNIDYEYLSQFKWCWHHGYVVSGSPAIRMHRVIAERAGVDCSQTIDHKNLDKLDNRRKNLRPATPAQQKMNCPPQKSNTSGFKGVYYRRDCSKWCTQIRCNGKRYFLGLFIDKLDAAKAYNKAAKKFFGEFARLNVV